MDMFRSGMFKLQISTLNIFVSAWLGWLSDFAWLCLAVLAWRVGLTLAWFTVLVFEVGAITGFTLTLGAGADFVLVLGAVVDFLLVNWCRREPWPGTELGSSSGWRRGS